VSEEQPKSERRGRSNWPLILLLVLIGYVLSSGPVLAICFWLREATGWDGFYAVMLLYFPLFILEHNNPLTVYIEWWVREVFNTVGPG